MINRVTLVGEIVDGVRFATTTRGDEMAYLFLRTWHRWFDPSQKRHATKSERHLVVTIRPDLIDVIRRRTDLKGLIYVEGALSSIKDLTPGRDPTLETAAVVIHRDGQLRFLGADTADSMANAVPNITIE
jgi:single-stranded DNA-binding protein